VSMLLIDGSQAGVKLCSYINDLVVFSVGVKLLAFIMLYSHVSLFIWQIFWHKFLGVIR
jgi:hypothetical protein